MRNFFLIYGAFNIGVGLERGWLPGVGWPFWVSLVIGATALTIGLMIGLGEERAR